MTLLVATGYASLDHPLALASPLRAEGTTLVAHRDAWPRPGGCPSYVALAAARAGQPAAPVMWVGEGSEGRALSEALAREGVLTEGIAAVAGAPRSPTAILIHQPGGGCACLFDSALGGREALTEAQRGLVARATHLCVSVGPPQVLGAILDARAPGARLYWAVKDDPHAFPPAARARLAAEADVVFHNRAERPLVEGAPALRVETRGAEGVAVIGHGREVAIPVEPIPVADATGAGDTLAGGFIAAEMAGEADPAAAARAGLLAAAALLRGRKG